MELLCPAKNLEAGIIAIKCGADAVYIGAEKFGARASAGNSLKDIENLISFAHRYWAKVYVTVNTILKDSEILEAGRLIKDLYEAGADAIIIQDMGLLELDLPPIPLFASTQTHNSTPEKVRFLEKAGFQRVILARELSLKEIKEIKAKTDIELEVFIHGSLCVSYSGQCYLSYAIGGRSANRGECGQPCRKPYTLIKESGEILASNKYLLSLKDLNLSGHIKSLSETGIKSCKIEGRLKDINYIKNIVSFYRKLFDRILSSKSSSGKCETDFEPDPDKTFNRGYCTYFFNGRSKDILSFNTPKSKGKIIGKVININKDSFVLEGNFNLHRGDGICFFDKDEILRGTYINNISDNLIFPDTMDFIRNDTIIYRNMDQDFFKKLKNAKIQRKISLKLNLYKKDDQLILEGTDEDGIKGYGRIGFNGEIAKNKDMAINNIKKQLTSLGETEFKALSIEIDLSNIYFIPIKDLNTLRRDLVKDIRLKREIACPKKNIKILKNSFPYPEKILTYEGNVMNNYARKFYYRHGVREIEPAVETGLNMKGKKVMTVKHCLKHIFNLCKSEEKLYLIDEKNKKYPLKFNCNSCNMEVIF